MYGDTWYILIISHATTNKHTDGIVIDKVAHRNQVSRSNLIRGNTLSSRDKLTRVRRDASATDHVLDFRVDNAYESLCGREVHDDNTHAECHTAQLIVEFENVSMHNISPTRWDGRGVSTDRFHRAEYASIWMNCW